MRSPFSFRSMVASGTWASEIMPALAEHVDDMAFVHSCWTESNNHSPALFQMNTGMKSHGIPLWSARGDIWSGHDESEPPKLRRNV